MTYVPGENDWLNTPYSFPSMQDKKVLVLGLGGGSDIIAAYAISQLLLESRPRKVIYANTKKEIDSPLEMITPHIGRIAPGRPSPAALRGDIHGTIIIDQSVPCGDEGCPWIFLIGDRMDRDAEKQLPSEICQKGFDAIIGVDIGGDSLAPSTQSGKEGRDKRMLRVLQQTGLPLFHVVVAPGADGESSYKELAAMFSDPDNRSRYLGSIRLDPVLPLLKSLSNSLDPQRTPRIILAAAEGQLKQRSDGRVVVPRGRKPSVPQEWLLRAFVFADSQGKANQPKEQVKKP